MSPIETAPLAIVDVHYLEQGARAACVVADHWEDATSSEERACLISNVLPYKPGLFFERELPCIVQVLAVVMKEPKVIVIDGYVELDEKGSPGLGGHLYEYFTGSRIVIGVAKTAFRGSQFAARVTRGTSARPLFVTSRGMPAQEAAELILRMHGTHRIPALLTRADHLARGLANPIGLMTRSQGKASVPS